MRRILFVLLSLLVCLATMPAAMPQPLAAQGCEDDAELVEQHVDPGEVVAPDSDVTVTWTLRNSGDCTWSRSYRLLFVRGERMDGPRTLRLREAVEPGETLTLAVDVAAPADAASYRGVWQLRNADGTRFGPELAIELEVDDQTAAATGVVLPEVLVFGGMGGGEDPEILRYCVVDGALVEEAETLTAKNTAMNLVIAFNYGARDEIARAAQKMAEAARSGTLDPATITPEMFGRFLDTKLIPDPDLVIRTSGEMRLSNFLLCQAAYAELIFMPCYWPDFGTAQLEEAIESFASRERRFGGVTARDVAL